MLHDVSEAGAEKPHYVGQDRRCSMQNGMISNDLIVTGTFSQATLIRSTR